MFFGRTGGSAHETEPIRDAGDRKAPVSGRGDLRFLHSRKTLSEQLAKYGFVDVSVTYALMLFVRC